MRALQFASVVTFCGYSITHHVDGFSLKPFASYSKHGKSGSIWMQFRGGSTEMSVSSEGGTSNSSDPIATRELSSTLVYNATEADPGSWTMDHLWYALQSAAETGLSSEEAALRLQTFGPNALSEALPTSTWQLIVEQFEDKLVQILLGVALLSAVFSYFEVRQSVGDEAVWKFFVEPAVILAILVINAAVGVVQSQSASDSLAALSRLQSPTATVIRDGTISTVDARTLVPGDILQIRVGDKVPADCRLIGLASSSFQADEGSLTGESVTIAKLPGDLGRAVPGAVVQDQNGMLFSGTVVTSGSGRAVVVQTGMDTEFGKIQQGVTDAAAEATKTPLALKLDEFGNTLTQVIGGICALVWVVSIPKMNDPSFGNFWAGAIYYAKVAVALGVAAIPEGLPAVITLCLSLGTRRMAQRNVIVRKLPSVETLGCTSVICTDKTGTLTTNEMTAVGLVLLEHEPGGEGIISEHSIEGYSYSPMGRIQEISPREVKDNPLGSAADVASVAALCNDAKIVGRDIDEVVKANESEKAFERVGEPTEAALCILSEKLGGMSNFVKSDGHTDRSGLHFPPSVMASANVDAWRSLHPRLATLEFNRDRKSMSVLCSFPKGDFPSASGIRGGVEPRTAGNRLLVKGAPNLLLERCTHVKFRDGTVAPLQGALRRGIENKLSEMAARPLRCLALAVKEHHELESSIQSFSPESDDEVTQHPLLSNPDNYKTIESGLTLVGVVGIKDPARPEVADSIKDCTKAGIRVMMITGDAKDTAVAIAKDVNIFPSAEEDSKKPLKAYEGREFFNKPEHEQLNILKEDNIVFCRAEPSDKRKLVKMLRSLNEVSAMTGDGVNDAPALKQSDIGIAMGITGTEVSKEAADMVLADDNFSTIVSAVEEGRRIYANMQAFICFLISCNIGEICVIFFATLAGFPEPLTAMHLLWVNLVTDGPPATALGFNPASPDLMERPPRPSNEPILTRWLLTRYAVTGLYVGFAAIGIFAQYYLSQGISLSELSRWSRCGAGWSPPNGLTCSDLFQGSARALPQTLSLTTLVCMEMLKALSAVSMDSSIFQVGPQQNKWLLLGVAGPLLLHIGVVYSSKLGLPALGESFGLVPLSSEQWVTVLSWALPILLVDEVLKAIGRRLYQDEAKREKST